MSAARTAFVTGATGFVGLNLVEVLLQQGWRVVALHRPTSDVSRLSVFPVERVSGDVTDLESLRQAMPDQPGAVFHVAGNTSLWRHARIEQLRINVKGTRNIVRVAREKGAHRLVCTSSAAAYGSHGGVITEETPSRGLASRIHYVRSKALAEREVRRGIHQGLAAVIMNPGHMIGPWDTHNWSRVFRLVAQGRLPGVPPGGGSFCHVKSVAEAHVAAAEQGRPGSNYLLGGAETSYRGLVLAITRLLNKRRRYPELPPRLLSGYAQLEEWIAPLFGREPDVTRDAVALLSENIYCSSKKAIRELDYKPCPLDAMLRDCHEWMVAHGLLGK